MVLNRIMVSLSLLVITTIFVLFTGCIANQYTNTSMEQTLPPYPSPDLTQINQPSSVGTPTPVLTEVPTVFTMSTTQYIPNTSGTSGSKTTAKLTEDQAWSYAVPYLQTRGLSNIKPNEKTSMGQSVWGKNSELTWNFEVHRKDIVELGGIIIIDAHDGHIVQYLEFV